MFLFFRPRGSFWGFGLGVPAILLVLIVLPLWIAYELCKALVFVLRDAGKLIAWAWRRGVTPKSQEDET